ncbi:hypothetical protein [Plantactinospora alkalitolerans]|nr:hypothetical protein [Plantactinospora alkalitolerans]
MMSTPSGNLPEARPLYAERLRPRLADGGPLPADVLSRITVQG